MNSNENKQMLWDLLCDNDAFTGLSNTQYQNIVQMFNTTLQTIGEIRNNTSLVEKNKVFITEMMTKLRSVRTSDNGILHTATTTPAPLTHEEIQNQKRSEFEKKLEKRQQDFTKYMKTHIPDTPDFSDKNTDEPLGNVEALVSAKLKERSYDSVSVNKPVTDTMPETIKAVSKPDGAVVNNIDLEVVGASSLDENTAMPSAPSRQLSGIEMLLERLDHMAASQLLMNREIEQLTKDVQLFISTQGT